MYKIILLTVAFYFVFQVSECAPGAGPTGYRGPYAKEGRMGFVGSRNRYIGVNSAVTTTTAAPTPKEELAKHGISMFALISLITLVLLFGLAIYYSVMCYPFVCSNEKNYSFMDVSSTMTGATSRSMQSSIEENFPHCFDSAEQKV